MVAPPAADSGPGPAPSSDGASAPPATPSLPAGYEAQAAWNDTDPSGRFAFEFVRVYGPPDGDVLRGPVCHLDQGRSYWSVSWSVPGPRGELRHAARQVSYAEARRKRGATLTFARFSQLRVEGGGLAELLGVADIA